MVTPNWKKSEDLGVIIADKGMIDDHMPTRVMDTLRTYHKKVSVETSLLFSRERVKERRDGQMATTIRNKIEQREIQLEVPPTIRADSACRDEVDGGERSDVEDHGTDNGGHTAIDIEMMEMREPVDNVSLVEEPIEMAETVDTLVGQGNGHVHDTHRHESTATESVLVVERYGNEYSELNPDMGTQL